MSRYNPVAIEKKWQKIWSEKQIYAAKDFAGYENLAEYKRAKQSGAKVPEKYVMLTEFPYPSGAGLHMGHLREYTLGDVIARYKRARGYNVLFPMAFDAFGMPTENFAIKNHVSPQEATRQNTANFRRQLDMMGYSIDWNRSFATSDPEYYHWTQWMFLQFFKCGMAFREKTWVNFCPFEKSVIANEEVVNGRHERCGTLVEKKDLTQWVLKITAYADRLIDGLKELDYPDRIANQQINWIGRSTGAEIDFAVEGEKEKITVYTTRPDTIFGATFVVLAPESDIAARLKKTAKNREKIEDYIAETAHKTEIERQENSREKTGARLDGVFATNPVNGEKLPIFVADYVLAGYGTGAIMAVPAHDERDFAFAKKFGIPVRQVVAPKSGEKTELPFAAKSGVLTNSGEFDGLDFATAKQKIVAKFASAMREKVQYRLRDWVYSRQRYWGEPIPIVYCDDCGIVPVPEDQLPLELPEITDLSPTEDGRSPLARVEDWANTTCPKCGKPARRETDTMPNWAGSNWYYLRYFDAHNSRAFADPDKLAYWRNVNLYLGGMEHTTLHLLYSRFHHEFLYDQGLVPTPEPYDARRGQGIILASDGRKMSKSLGNVVDPTEIVNAGYGADAARVAIAFIAPYEQTTPWSPEAVAGAYRFLARVWSFAEGGNFAEKSAPAPAKAIARAVKKVGDDIENMSFNTAIAALMEAFNALAKAGVTAVGRDDFAKYLQILAPFAPHLASEIWTEILRENDEIHLKAWPDFDKNLLRDDRVKIAVQVNGKLRGELEIAVDEPRESVENSAQKLENVAKFLEGKAVAKVIYVPRKIVNIVAK